MFKRYFWISLALAVLLLGSLAVAVALAESTASIHAGSAQSFAATPVLDGAALHVVRSGETLGLIARRYGVGMRQLAAYNGIANPDRIYVGQALRIPNTAEPTALPPRPTPIAPTPIAPTPVACPCDEIAIIHPGRGVTITNPARVLGVCLFSV